MPQFDPERLFKRPGESSSIFDKDTPLLPALETEAGKVRKRGGPEVPKKPSTFWRAIEIEALRDHIIDLQGAEEYWSNQFRKRKSYYAKCKLKSIRESLKLAEFNLSELIRVQREHGVES